MSTFNQKTYVALKGKLTSAINSKDPKEIIRVAEEGLRKFEEMGYPDDWSRWERAIDDARLMIKHPSRFETTAPAAS